MDKRVRKHIGSKEIESLDEYRQRYAQYRMDEDFRKPTASFHGWLPGMIMNLITTMQIWYQKREDFTGSLSCAQDECLPSLLRIYAS